MQDRHIESRRIKDEALKKLSYSIESGLVTRIDRCKGRNEIDCAHAVTRAKYHQSLDENPDRHPITYLSYSFVINIVHYYYLALGGWRDV